jgi:hypothetical protein
MAPFERDEKAIYTDILDSDIGGTPMRHKRDRIFDPLMFAHLVFFTIVM